MGTKIGTKITICHSWPTGIFLLPFLNLYMSGCAVSECGKVLYV